MFVKIKTVITRKKACSQINAIKETSKTKLSKMQKNALHTFGDKKYVLCFVNSIWYPDTQKEKQCQKEASRASSDMPRSSQKLAQIYVKKKNTQI